MTSSELDRIRVLSRIFAPERPHGVLLGIGGAIVALLLVWGAVYWLREPLGDLIGLYDLTLVLQALDARDSAMLLGFSAGLGWLGALVSLRQHLDRH